MGGQKQKREYFGGHVLVWCPMSLFAIPPVIVRIGGAIKQCRSLLHKHYTTVKTVDLKNLYAEAGVKCFGELIQLIGWGVWHSAWIALFKFSVQHGFRWLGKITAPHVFAPSVFGILDGRYFSDLMARHTYLDCADVILLALEHAPNDLRAELFAKSVRIHSDYYTEKLIPPVVSKDGIVALIQNNNMPLLAKILTPNDLNFMVATAAILGHHKLLETFEHRVDLSEVIQFIGTEKWSTYRVYIHQDDRNNLISEYQSKLLRRAIQNEISEAPEKHENVKRRRM